MTKPKKSVKTVIFAGVTALMTVLATVFFLWSGANQVGRIAEYGILAANSITATLAIIGWVFVVLAVVAAGVGVYTFVKDKRSHYDLPKLDETDNAKILRGLDLVAEQFPSVRGLIGQCTNQLDSIQRSLADIKTVFDNNPASFVMLDKEFGTGMFMPLLDDVLQETRRDLVSIIYRANSASISENKLQDDVSKVLTRIKPRAQAASELYDTTFSLTTENSDDSASKQLVGLVNQLTQTPDRKELI